MTVRIRFTASAGDRAFATVHTHEVEFPEMPSEEELDMQAEEHMWETVRPDKGWEVVGP